MTIKRVTLVDEKGKRTEVVEFTATLYSKIEPWMEFQQKYNLSSRQVVKEVVSILQMDAWSDVFNGLEPLIKKAEEAEKK